MNENSPQTTRACPGTTGLRYVRGNLVSLRVCRRPGAPPEAADRDVAPGGRPGAGVRRLAAACLLLAAALDASANEEPVSAFAASVGARDRSSGPAPAVTVYVVPEDRTFLLTDILVANHGQEVGPLYLADSQRTRCSVELLETMLMPNNDLFDGQFSTLQNAHVIFSSGIPFGPGEPVIATLAGGSRGVDVTITGKLLPAPRWSRGIRLPGGARADEAEHDAEHDAAAAPRP